MNEPATPSGDIDDRIVAAAIALVTTRGLGGTTMSAVASEAGVSRQTLYTRFGDIDSIVVASLGSHADESATMTRSVVETVATFDEKVGVVVSQVMAGAAHAVDITELRAGLSAEARARIDDHESHFRTLVSDIIRFGIETGDVSSETNIELSTEIVLGMVAAAARAAALSEESVAATTTAKSMIVNALSFG